MSVNSDNQGNPNAANEACRRLAANLEAMLFEIHGDNTPDVVENVANNVFPEGADPHVIAAMRMRARARAHGRGNPRGHNGSTHNRRGQ